MSCPPESAQIVWFNSPIFLPAGRNRWSRGTLSGRMHRARFETITEGIQRRRSWLNSLRIV